MPETYVVHLGNSKELMDVAEDSVAKRVLREHVRESLGVRNDDLLFAIINSMSLPILILYLFLFIALVSSNVCSARYACMVILPLPN
jgi:hypothetical protein